VVTLEDCLAMEAAKTGALLGYAASVGAVLADADPATVDALDSYGRQLGLAYQAVDDVLGIWGEPEVTGKPAGNDLRQRKKSMPVAVVLSAGGTAAADLAAVYGRRGALDDDEVARAAAIIESAGGREATLAEAGRRLEAALVSLEGVELDSRALRELEEVARFVVERDA
jgi:geranylgeranyl diphosphate synthase type I